MSIVKKHWVSFLCGGAILACVVLGVSLFVPRSLAVAEPYTASAVSVGDWNADGFDEVAIADIRQLRQELCLADMDLTAIGCDRETAESIVSYITSWYLANRVMYKQLSHNDAIAESNIKLLKAVSNVDRSSDELALLAQARQAFDNRMAAIMQLSSAIDAMLSADQLSALNAARSNRSLPSPYKYLAGLSLQQRHKMRAAHTEWVTQSCSKLPQSRDSAELNLADQLDNIAGSEIWEKSQIEDRLESN